jgi:hypothetical protein
MYREKCDSSAPLGPSGAACVEQHRGVVGRARPDVPVVGAREQVREPGRPGGPGAGIVLPDDDSADVRELLECLADLGGYIVRGDDQPGVGVLEMVADLSGLQQRIERHQRQPGLEDPEVGQDELRDVGKLDRHLFPRPQPAAPQARSDPAGGLVGLGVTHGVERKAQKVLFREGKRGLAQHDGQVEAHLPVLSEISFCPALCWLRAGGDLEQGAGRIVSLRGVHHDPARRSGVRSCSVRVAEQRTQPHDE